MTKARGLPFVPTERRQSAPYAPKLSSRYHPYELLLTRPLHHLGTEMLHLATYVPENKQVEVVSIFMAHGYRSPSVTWQRSDPNYSWVAQDILLGDRENNLELIANLMPYAFLRSDG